MQRAHRVAPQQRPRGAPRCRRAADGACSRLEATEQCLAKAQHRVGQALRRWRRAAERAWLG